MTKKDLNNNMVVRLKNGELFNYLVIENENGEIEKYFSKLNTKISLDTYNDDLTHKKYAQLKVIEIFKQIEIVNANTNKIENIEAVSIWRSDDWSE